MSGKYILIRHETLSVRHSNRKFKSPLLLHAGRKIYKEKEKDLYDLLLLAIPEEYHGDIDQAAENGSIRLILGEDKKASDASEMTRGEKLAAVAAAEDLLPPARNQSVGTKTKPKGKSEG